MTGFQLQRLGQVMEPEPGNLLEAEGVLNPAAIRGPDGKLYLFPRLVARGNYSRMALSEFGLMTPATRQASSGSALHWNRKRITSFGLTAASAVRIRASRSWKGSRAMR